MSEVGKILLNARKEKNVTIDKVFLDTRIPRKHIQALESDNVPEFPAEVYYLGGLRRYAGYLGLNPSELVQMYQESKVVPSKSVPSKSKTVQKIEIRFVIITSFLIFAVILAALMMRFVQVTNSNKIIVVNKNKIEKAAPKEHDNVLRLEVKCVSSTWIRINGDDNVLFEGILSQGRGLVYSAKNKFVIKIGYTSGVKIKLNDKDVDVSKGAKQEVNEIVLTRENIKSDKQEK